MSIVYLVALTAFCIVFLGVLYDAIASVSRKPVWTSSLPTLSLVETVDRREQQLPFVGQERRQEQTEAGSAKVDTEQPLRRVS